MLPIVFLLFQVSGVGFESSAHPPLFLPALWLHGKDLRFAICDLPLGHSRACRSRRTGAGVILFPLLLAAQAVSLGASMNERAVRFLG